MLKKTVRHLDERLTRAHPSNRGGLAKLPQSNPQIYPQALLFCQLAFASTPHYLVSPSRQTPTCWVLHGKPHKHICTLSVHTPNQKSADERQQRRSSFTDFEQAPQQRQQSDGDLITLRPFGDGATTSSGASVTASTRLQEPGRRFSRTFPALIASPHAYSHVLSVWRCRYGMNGGTARHSTALASN